MLVTPTWPVDEQEVEVPDVEPPQDPLDGCRGLGSAHLEGRNLGSDEEIGSRDDPVPDGVANLSPNLELVPVD